MKKIFYILSICVMTILQPSCDALDLAPEDYYGAGNFWKEASQQSIHVGSARPIKKLL